MFSNRIRERREKLGLSQTRLARLVGVAEPALSNVELGKWQPWPKVRHDLAKVLGVTEDYLFSSQNEREPRNGR